MALKCIDASVVVAFLVPSQSRPGIPEIWKEFGVGSDEFIAPPFMWAEVTTAIRRLASRKVLTMGEAASIVDDFLLLDIISRTPRNLYRRAYELATQYGLPTVYDSCYLAVANTYSCDLLTLDERFFNALSYDHPNVKLVK